METQARPPQALRSFLARFLAAVRNLSTHVSATAQLRPLDKFDTSQLQNASPSYGECRIVGLEKAPRPTHKARRPKRLWQYSNRSYRSYGTGSTGRTFRYKKAFFSYEESATAKFAPSTRAKLSPAQSPPRTPVRWQPTPAPDLAPGACPERGRRARIPLPKASPEALSQMSHFSATKTRF